MRRCLILVLRYACGPYKRALPTAAPADPLINRFRAPIQVHGTTFKELIHAEFGDGIMSAIDKGDTQQKGDPMCKKPIEAPTGR